jgi:hypothetical protein
MKNKLEQINWLKTQIHKDNKELDNEKSKFIELIKKSKKEDLIPVKEKKLTLWQRIKKVLMG